MDQTLQNELRLAAGMGLGGQMWKIKKSLLYPDQQENSSKHLKVAWQNAKSIYQLEQTHPSDDARFLES